MITRIVRMHFVPEKVETFLTVFNESKSRIRSFPGVLRLELHRDADHANVYYTVSDWESTAHLEAYRKSPLFEEVWKQTKVLFASKAIAFSLEKQQTISN